MGRVTSLDYSYGDNKVRFMLSTSAVTQNKPYDGVVIQGSWDWDGGYDSQLDIGNDGHLYVRGGRGKASGMGVGEQTWTDWYTVLDSNNYTSYYPTGVKDYNNGNTITFGYSTSGMSSTSWLGSWDGYKLRAIAPNVLTVKSAYTLTISHGNEIRFNNNSSASSLWFNYLREDGNTCNVTSFYWGNGNKGASATMVAGSFSTSSSKKIKENISDMSEEEASKILNIGIKSFDYKEGFGEKNQFGCIAEDIYNEIPSVVHIPDEYNKDTPLEENNIGFPSIDYSKFVPYIIKMIQIQQKEINELKGDR